MNWKIVTAQELEEAIFKLKFAVVRRIEVRPGMRIVDVGCGQGGFSAALSRAVGEKGEVVGVDVSDEYVSEFWRTVEKWGLRVAVTFIQTNAVDMERVFSRDATDMAVSYRLLEELKDCRDMSKVVREMAKVVKRKSTVCLVEMSTEPKNEAESNYLRLHKESGDCFFEPNQILEEMKQAALNDVQVETFDTDIWFSPEIAKQNLEFAQLWYDEEVERRLGPRIDKFGMKYPALLLFSGVKGPA